MITIQELHKYNNLVDMNLAPAILCKIDPDHGGMTTWVNEKGEPCFWCFSCNLKYYPSLSDIQNIKSLLHL